jgi:hypothetical protein
MDLVGMGAEDELRPRKSYPTDVGAGCLDKPIKSAGVHYTPFLLRPIPGPEWATLGLVP